MTKDEFADLFTNAFNLIPEYIVREITTADGSSTFAIGYSVDDLFTIVDAAASASDAESRAFDLEMQSAAEAFAGQLFAAGFAIVPVEMTPRMASEGESAASVGIGKPVDDEAIRRVYRVMIEEGRVK